MTQNLYCSRCLKTRGFVATERGYRCPGCRKVLLVSDPPTTRIPIRQREVPSAQKAG